MRRPLVRWLNGLAVWLRRLALRCNELALRIEGPPRKRTALSRPRVVRRWPEDRP